MLKSDFFSDSRSFASPVLSAPALALMADSDLEVGKTLGALLLGASAAFALSGVVGLQCVVYFKMYPDDGYTIKSLVTAVWTLDFTHSAFLVASLVDYFVTNFGNKTHINYIPWSIALTVVMTAIQTFLAQCRLTAEQLLRTENLTILMAAKMLNDENFPASKNNWYITGPIVRLFSLRLLSSYGISLTTTLAASVSTAEMVHLHKYSAFTLHYPGWVFTSGLALSAGTDVIITGFLYYFLREMRRRTASTIMIQIVDTLTLYTLETGALTWYVAFPAPVTHALTARCFQWLTMPTNLIFLGLHFVIAKRMCLRVSMYSPYLVDLRDRYLIVYANSLLASLNTRQELRRMRTGTSRSRRSGFSSENSRIPDPLEVYMSPTKSQRLEISVQKTVDVETADAVTELTSANGRRSRRFSAWDPS
ncbi:hypothetical protein H0H92_000718 [Tricholoma furcatifolium]|nr:hypothetical protein H0H92_000718 [Tricholoma furcatifolium]